MGAIADVLLDRDGKLLASNQNWKTSVQVNIDVEMKEILGSYESLLELLALSGRRCVTDTTQAAQTARIGACSLSYRAGQVDNLFKVVPGMSEFEFRMNRDSFLKFLRWVCPFANSLQGLPSIANSAP